MDFNPNTLLMVSRDQRQRPARDPEGRTRFVYSAWPRIPEGRLLVKGDAPTGLSTPSGLLWAHELDEICLIARHPNVRAWCTYYSRSQIKELGENYREGEWDSPLVPPRVRRPWPVLKLPLDHPANTNPPIGAIDGGCIYEHCDFGTYELRSDEPDSGGVVRPENQFGIPHPCSTDPQNPCTGRLVLNNGPTPVKSETGRVYDYLWCEHFVSGMKAAPEPHLFVGRAVEQMSHLRVLADEDGVNLFEHMGGWRRFIPRRIPPLKDHSGVIQSVSQGVSMPTVQIEVDSDVIMGDAAGNGGAEGVDATAAKTQRKKKIPHAQGLFSVKDLPKLEEFIPEGLFPDVLLVHDPDKLTNHKQSSKKAVRYKRVYPKFERDSQESKSSSDEHVAHLYLHSKNRFGTGHHSTGQCTVATKLANPRCTAHRLLQHEGKLYNSFPKHVQEEYCGYNLVPPCRYPVPVGAIVPKFFGYYLPVDEDGNVIEKCHEECNETEPCCVDWMSPILLMEECGTPVEPKKFTVDQRTECFSLVLRLHLLGFVQGSFYVRNVLIQPGPLTLPPEMRTMDSPSFRIIDFGRGTHYDVRKMNREKVDQEARIKAQRSFTALVNEEESCAREEFLIERIVGF